MDKLLATIDPDQRLTEEIAHAPRGRTTPEKKVNLPDGWLKSQTMTQDEQVTVREAELSVSGG